MGAAPSREVATHSLPRAPFYGQRQHIVLIPLLKDFFPSAHCALFKQLYDARCDPAVRFYHYAQERPTDANTNGEAASHGCGGVSVSCSPADEFPPVPYSREEFYRIYIEEGGERLVYETDEAMLRAYEADADSVRPIPCAVAFFYMSSPSGGGAVAEAAEHSSPANEREGKAAAGGSAGQDGVENCVSVLGCHVRVTGFVGDISRLFRPSGLPPVSSLESSPSTREADGYEVDLYLTKSAGDHNRTHVLLSAIYTYAEQWQRVRLRHTARKGGEDHSHSLCAEERSAMTVGSRSCAAADPESPPAVLPHSQPSTSVDCRRFLQAVTPPEPLNPLPPYKDESLGGSVSVAPTAAGGMTRGGGGARVPMRMLEWFPPPLASVRMRGRRTNVPLLCFLREVRTILLGLHTVATLSSMNDSTTATTPATAGEPQEGPAEPSPSPCRALEQDRAIRTAALKDLVLWLEGVPPPSGSDASEGEVTDTLVNLCAPVAVVQSFVGHVMGCLLHHLNPLEIRRALPNGHGTPPPPTPPPPYDEEGDQEHNESHETSQQRPKGCTARPLRLCLPEEKYIVEPWTSFPIPRADPTEECRSPSAADPQLPRGFLPDASLYWIVGVTLAERESASALLSRWHQEGKAVLVSDDVDEVNEPIKVGSSPEDFAEALKALSAGSQSRSTEGSPLLDAGLAIELLPATSDALSLGAVKVHRLPLEEALLGELNDACKQAREASPADEHWVRSETQLRESNPDAGAVTCLPEATNIVGDATSCLYRVVLAPGATRIVAVTPYFLKVPRKKMRRKHTVKPRDVEHGTAVHVFYAAPSLGLVTQAGQRSTEGEEQGNRAASTAAKGAGRAADEVSAPAGEGRKDGGGRVTAQASEPAAEAPLDKAATARAGKTTVAAGVEGVHRREGQQRGERYPTPQVVAAENRASRTEKAAGGGAAGAPEQPMGVPTVPQRRDLGNAGFPPFPANERPPEYRMPSPLAQPSSFTNQPPPPPSLPLPPPPLRSASLPFGMPANRGPRGMPYGYMGKDYPHTSPLPALPQEQQRAYDAYHYQQQQPPLMYKDPCGQPLPPPPFHPSQPPPLSPWAPGGYAPPYHGAPPVRPQYSDLASAYLPPPSLFPPHPYPPPANSAGNLEMLMPLQGGAFGQPSHQPSPAPVLNTALGREDASRIPLPRTTYTSPGQPHQQGALPYGRAHHFPPGVSHAYPQSSTEPDALGNARAGTGATLSITAEASTSGERGGAVARHVSFGGDEGSLKTHASGDTPSLPPFAPPVLESVQPPHHARVASLQNWDRSSNSQLVFLPDDMNSPLTQDSVSFPFARSNLDASSTTLNNDGAGSSGAVHVTVVRRRAHHHHQDHTRTESFISDAATNDGANASQMGGGGGGGKPMSSSPGSNPQLNLLGTHDPPLSQSQQQEAPEPGGSVSDLPPTAPAAASTGEHAGQKPGVGAAASAQGKRQTTKTGGNGANQQGAASSTRSGDASTAGAKQQMKSGKYRWDWRSVSIEYNDED